VKERLNAIPSPRRSWRSTVATAFSAIVLAAGCARFHPQPLSAEKSAAELESRSLTNAALRTFIQTNLQRQIADWPVTQWDFDSLTLAAFYYHPDLELARAQWQTAEGAIRTAGARPNPTLSLVPGYDTTHNPGLSPWFPAVSFDQVLETMGKRGKRIAAAERASESARLNVATTAWQIRGNLRMALLDDIAARQHGELLQKQLTLQQEIVKLIGQQVEAGTLAKSDAVSFQIALQKLQLDYADAQSQRAQARTHLAESIGVPNGALEGIELPTDVSVDPAALTDMTSADARRAALTNRTDILEALADYAASEFNLQEEIAKQYPDVHINPGYQFDQGDNKWSVGITFDLPLLDQNQGPIAEAEGQRRQAAAKFNSVQAKVLADIERAVATYRTSEKNSETLTALAATEAKQRESVEAQFKAGAAERTELLNSQFEFLNAQLSEVDARSKLQQAAAALEDAIQRPLDARLAVEQARVTQPYKP
jgi:cobalt-zinc-cadmium efflux system outer membrane protein